MRLYPGVKGADEVGNMDSGTHSLEEGEEETETSLLLLDRKLNFFMKLSEI